MSVPRQLKLICEKSVVRHRKIFSDKAGVVYGFQTVGILPGEFVDKTDVPLRVSARSVHLGTTLMSSLPPRRALPFPAAWETQERPTMPVVSERRIPSDEEVMSRIQSNDTNALEILFERYARLVYRIARGIIRDAGEAEDVVQESFFHVYKKSGLFDESKGTVKNWILQIALHRTLDRKAHLARRGFYLGTNIDSLDDILLGRTDLDREVGAKMDLEQLEKAFEELPNTQRLTLELFYFEGLDLREISQKLNQPLGNTRHHFYRGLERLRKSAFVQSLRETKRC